MIKQQNTQQANFYDQMLKQQSSFQEQMMQIQRDNSQTLGIVAQVLTRVLPSIPSSSGQHVLPSPTPLSRQSALSPASSICSSPQFDSASSSDERTNDALVLYKPLPVDQEDNVIRQAIILNNQRLHANQSHGLDSTTEKHRRCAVLVLRFIVWYDECKTAIDPQRKAFWGGIIHYTARSSPVKRAGRRSDNTADRKEKEFILARPKHVRINTAMLAYLMNTILNTQIKHKVIGLSLSYLKFMHDKSTLRCTWPKNDDRSGQQVFPVLPQWGDKVVICPRRIFNAAIRCSKLVLSELPSAMEMVNYRFPGNKIKHLDPNPLSSAWNSPIIANGEQQLLLPPLPDLPCDITLLPPSDDTLDQIIKGMEVD